MTQADCHACMRTTMVVHPFMSVAFGLRKYCAAATCRCRPVLDNCVTNQQRQGDIRTAYRGTSVEFLGKLAHRVG